MTTLPMIVSLQARFKSRLRAIRDEQLDRAEQRKYEQRIEWREYLKSLRQWRDWCEQRNETAWEHQGLIVASLLVAGLRRLAGISAKVGHGDIRPSQDNMLGGHPGFRSCSLASWDNALRAVEEDR